MKKHFFKLLKTELAVFANDIYMQCIQKVFRPPSLFILFCYVAAWYYNCLNSFFFLINLHSVPHNDEVKTEF